MYPLVFCRKCGQEFYSARAWHYSDGRSTKYEPRKVGDTLSECEENVPGYFYLDSENPWPDNLSDIANHKNLPGDWLEEHDGSVRIRKRRKDWLPENVNVGSD